MPEISVDTSLFSQPLRLLWDNMESCTLCPRRCRVNRLAGQTGFCGIGALPKVSSAGPHFGEEDVLVGSGGSGTIFFAGCNLRCMFCQNYEISQYRWGEQLSIDQLAEQMLILQKRGCENINLVTPTHVVAAAMMAVELAKKNGLSLPVVYNTGGYDSVETLKLLDGLVDIYMPDMKYSDADISSQLSSADDYPEVNLQAVREMHRQVGDLHVINGIAVKGLLVRHLVLPNGLAGSKEIIDFLADEISLDTTINIMGQYRPCYLASSDERINRRPTAEEIAQARRYAIKKGLNVLR
ncbi:MAG: radical SAM protein [Planctomycetes bacterium]|nr:radical SAM protein [Planctomycetota bacterium]